MKTKAKERMGLKLWVFGLVFSTFFIGKIKAQVNLVTNPSFENYVLPCPGSSPNGQLHPKVADWFSSGPDPTHGFPSCDLYCGQSNYSGCSPGPSPLAGSAGAAYIGFHTRIFSPPYNESVLQTLSSPLVAGNCYLMEFEAMTCQGGFFAGGGDSLCVYVNVNTSHNICPSVTPGVDRIGCIPYSELSNTVWKSHSFSFIAPANANVLIFSGDCNTGNETYYYLDNVRLYDSSACTVLANAKHKIDLKCEEESILISFVPNEIDKLKAVHLERSLEGRDFERIKTWSDLSIRVEDVFRHSEVISSFETPYYRFQWIDLDGKIAYSEIGQSDCNPKILEQIGFSLFPNPGAEISTLKPDQAVSGARVSVFDCFGKKVKDLGFMEGNEMKINAREFASGIYLVRLTGDKVHASRRWVVD